MDKIDFLQRVIDYIEENLKSEIQVDDLVKLSGFSTYHFYHIFKEYVGMPVFTYITNRRLKHAIYEAFCGTPLIEAALGYGFDTHAGFFKAFKRQYGCSPKKYLKLVEVKEPLAFNLREETKIMLTAMQIRGLLSNWEVDQKSEINPCYGFGGTVKSNNTWYVGEKYIFKTGKDIPGLRTHIGMAKALKREGMASAWPIKTKDGKEFLIDEDRFYVVLNRLDGNFLTPEERYSDDRFEIGKKYGKAIGKLHKALEKENNEIEVRDSNAYETVMNWAMDKARSIMEQWGCPLPEKFFEEYVKGFKDLQGKLPHHLIHRDANPSNIMFSNGEVSGFIDFEISHKNFRIFDPCYCATGILSEAENVEGGFEKWPEILKGIIEGYDSVCNLTKEEREAIQYVIYSIQMIFIAWLDGKEEQKSVAMMNRKMLMWMWENKEKCFGKL